MLEIEDVAEVVGNLIREATSPVLARLEKAEQELAEVRSTAGGVGLADAMIDEGGRLVLTTSNGTIKQLGRVRGEDGQPGENGKHGLSADDVDLTVKEDGRTLEFSLKQGDYEYAFEIYFPVPLYRGVYQQDASYEKGDIVTWAGALWHCDKETSERPDGEHWTLCVKKGRDGRDAGK